MFADGTLFDVGDQVVEMIGADQVADRFLSDVVVRVVDAIELEEIAQLFRVFFLVCCFLIERIFITSWLLDLAVNSSRSLARLSNDIMADDVLNTILYVCLFSE